MKPLMLQAVRKRTARQCQSMPNTYVCVVLMFYICEKDLRNKYQCNQIKAVSYYWAFMLDKLLQWCTGLGWQGFGGLYFMENVWATVESHFVASVRKPQFPEEDKTNVGLFCRLWISDLSFCHFIFIKSHMFCRSGENIGVHPFFLIL